MTICSPCAREPHKKRKTEFSFVSGVIAMGIYHGGTPCIGTFQH